MIEETVQTKNQGDRNQGPKMRRSTPCRGDLGSSQCDRRRGIREWRGQALPGHGKDFRSGKVNTLFNFRLSCFEKY